MKGARWMTANDKRAPMPSAQMRYAPDGSVDWGEVKRTHEIQMSLERLQRRKLGWLRLGRGG